MHLTVSHSTTYQYDTPVAYGLQELRLTPHTGVGQTVTSWQTVVDGATSQVVFDDQYMNRVELVRLEPDALETKILAQGTVETTDTAGVIEEHSGFTPLWVFLRSTRQTGLGTGIRNLTKGLRDEPDEISRMHALSNRVRDSVDYETGRTVTNSTAEEVLQTGSGVCQDHAHIFVTGARSLGVPARYVSGYLLIDDQIAQDASHAWAEVWIEELGWLGFDVSNGISPDDRYVRVAAGLDYSEAAPISGVRFGVGEEQLQVSVQVQQQ